jgi:hypothetical protein
MKVHLLSQLRSMPKGVYRVRFGEFCRLAGSQEQIFLTSKNRCVWRGKEKEKA